MVMGRRYEPPDLAVVTLAGIITSRDQTELLEWVRALLRRVRSVRVLIHLEAFAGWRLDDPASGGAAWLNDDEGVLKIAFVGRLEWRPSVFSVIAQPVRALPIRYFETDAMARRWLGGSTLDSSTPPPPDRTAGGIRD
jgi:hypothetical protein